MNMGENELFILKISVKLKTSFSQPLLVTDCQLVEPLPLPGDLARTPSAVTAQDPSVSGALALLSAPQVCRPCTLVRSVSGKSRFRAIIQNHLAKGVRPLSRALTLVSWLRM